MTPDEMTSAVHRALRLAGGKPMTEAEMTRAIREGIKLAVSDLGHSLLSQCLDILVLVAEKNGYEVKVTPKFRSLRDLERRR